MKASAKASDLPSYDALVELGDDSFVVPKKPETNAKLVEAFGSLRKQNEALIEQMTPDRQVRFPVYNLVFDSCKAMAEGIRSLKITGC